MNEYIGEYKAISDEYAKNDRQVIKEYQYRCIDGIICDGRVSTHSNMDIVTVSEHNDKQTTVRSLYFSSVLYLLSQLYISDAATANELRYQKEMSSEHMENISEEDKVNLASQVVFAICEFTALDRKILDKFEFIEFNQQN